MLELQNIYKSFGAIKAVAGISFQVKAGEVLGFLGPNGAGKSTTMKIIAGYMNPDSGRILLNDVDIASDPKLAKQNLGYLAEGAPAYLDMQVVEFLNFIAQVRGVDGLSRRLALQRIADQVKIAEVMHQPIGTLSKGFRRRVGIAQALLHDPKILILDEPTDGLDPNQKHEIRNLIKAMAADKVIVISTHILEEVEAVCTRALIVAAGQLIVDTTPAALKAKSKLANTIDLDLQDISEVEANSSLVQLPSFNKLVASLEVVSGTGVQPLKLRLHLNQGQATNPGQPIDSAASKAVASNQVNERSTLMLEIVNLFGTKLLNFQKNDGHLDEVFRELTVNVQRPT